MLSLPDAGQVGYEIAKSRRLPPGCARQRRARRLFQRLLPLARDRVQPLDHGVRHFDGQRLHAPENRPIAVGGQAARLNRTDSAP